MRGSPRQCHPSSRLREPAASAAPTRGVSLVRAPQTQPRGLGWLHGLDWPRGLKHRGPADCHLKRTVVRHGERADARVLGLDACVQAGLRPATRWISGPYPSPYRMVPHACRPA
jgi:hypothetical protein